MMVRLVLEAEEAEVIDQKFRESFGHVNWFRINLIALEATIPEHKTREEKEKELSKELKEQKNIDWGVPLDAVSRMSGHSSTKTTEKYYFRITNVSAILEAQRIYANASRPQELARRPEPKRTPSEKNSWLSGYG